MMDYVYRTLPTHVPRSPMRNVLTQELAFQHFQCLLPARPERQRPEPVQLHVSSKTKTILSLDTDRYLVDRADGIMFVADTARMRIEAALEYRDLLHAWTHDREIVVFQLDDAGYTSAEYTDASGTRVREEPAVTLTEAELRPLLRIGDRPVVTTKVVEGEGIAQAMRTLLDLVVPATTLCTLPLPAAIEALQGS